MEDSNQKTRTIVHSKLIYKITGIFLQVSDTIYKMPDPIWSINKKPEPIHKAPGLPESVQGDPENIRIRGW
jgi:hypothetical protein